MVKVPGSGEWMLGGGKEGAVYSMGPGANAPTKRVQAFFNAMTGLKDPRALDDNHQCAFGDLFGVQACDYEGGETSGPHVHGSLVQWPGMQRVYGWPEKSYLGAFELLSGAAGLQEVPAPGKPTCKQAQDPANEIPCSDLTVQHCSPIVAGAGAGNCVLKGGIPPTEDVACAFDYGERYVEPDGLPAYCTTDALVTQNLKLETTASCPASDGMPGGFLSVSANGTTGGVVWGSVQEHDGQAAPRMGTMHAFDAATLKHLWTEPTKLPFSKYTPPIVAGGRMYHVTNTAAFALGFSKEKLTCDAAAPLAGVASRVYVYGAVGGKL